MAEIDDGRSSAEIRRIRTAYAERERSLAQADFPDRSNPGYQRLVREYHDELQRLLADRLQPRSVSDCRILDVGCGFGIMLNWLHERGVPAQNLFGIDLLPNRIEIARKTFPNFTFVLGNAEQLEFAQAPFDLVLAFTVFSSILDDAMAKNVASSMSRMLAPGGAVVWYDMRYPNPSNPHLRAMTRRRIRQLFPGFELDLETISLLPPVARRLGHFTERMYPLLATLPFLRSHYLGFLRPAVATNRKIPGASDLHLRR